jgi:hypothetical protein
MTKYEKSPHDRDGIFSPLNDYEGMIYPPAIKDFKNNFNEFVKSVRTGNGEYYDTYYSHLDLTNNELNDIADRLSHYKDEIIDIVSDKEQKKDVFDIYKYGTDKYDNCYALYKLYKETDPSFKMKQNTTGCLWMRRKDHPIAFPVFGGRYPNVETDEKSINGNIKLLSKNIDGSHDMTNDVEHMSYFYDFEFDALRQTIFLVAYPVNNEIDHNPTEIANINYKKYEFGEIIICNIE